MTATLALALLVQAAPQGTQQGTPQGAPQGAAGRPAPADTSRAPARRAAAEVVPDLWFGADKAKHFVLAGFMQGAGYGLLRTAGARHGEALLGAGVAALAASVGKELYDRRKTHFSVRDLFWDVAGAGAVAVLLSRVER